MNCKLSKYNIILKRNKKNVILLNTLTNSIILLNNETFEKMLNVKNEQNFENFNDLLKQGFIVNENFNETNFVLQREAEGINSNNEILNIVFAPTMNCNLRCKYCFEKNSEKTRMSQETLNGVLNFLKNFIFKKTFIKKVTLNWFGGEPLLELNSILFLGKELKDFCEKNSIEFNSSIITNGILFDRKTAIQLKENCNLKKCQITLDGTEKQYCEMKQATPKQYYAVRNNIKTTYDIVKLNIRLNCNKENFEDIKQVVKELLIDDELKNKITVYVAAIKNYFGSCSNEFLEGDLQEEFLKFKTNDLKIKNASFKIQKPKKISCGFLNKNNFVIGPEGEFYKCEHRIGRKKAVIGNYIDGFYYNDEYNYFTNNSHLKKCLNCKYFPLCLSGCKDEQAVFKINANYCKNKKNGIIKKYKSYILNQNS